MDGYEFSTPSPLARLNLQSRDTLTIVFDVKDDHGVRWVGLRFGGAKPLSDSIRVDGTAFRVTARFLMEGAPFDTFTVRAFARNVAGRISDVVPTMGRVAVYARGTPTSVRLLPVPPSVRMATDWRGSRLLLAYGDWGVGPTSITSLDLRTLDTRSVGTLPGFVHDFDVVPSGDSIIATVGEDNALYVVPVARPDMIDRIPLEIDTAAFRGGRSIRVTAANIAVVSIGRPAPNDAERLMTVNLITGEQRLRTDAFENRDTYRHVPLFVSGDRRRVVALGSSTDTCCRGHVYESASDGFVVAGPLSAGTLNSVSGFIGLSLSFDGTRSIDEQRATYDATLQRTGVVALLDPHPQDEGSARDVGGVAISTDGTLGYFGHGNGIVAVRLADGAALERDELPWSPAVPYRSLPTGDILVLADGKLWMVTPHRVSPRRTSTPANATVASPVAWDASVAWTVQQHR